MPGGLETHEEAEQNAAESAMDSMMPDADQLSDKNEKAPDYNDAVTRVSEAMQKINKAREKYARTEQGGNEEELLAKAKALIKYAQEKGWDAGAQRGSKIEPTKEVSAVISQIHENMWAEELGVHDITDADQINEQLERKFSKASTRAKVVKNFEEAVDKITKT